MYYMDDVHLSDCEHTYDFVLVAHQNCRRFSPNAHTKYVSLQRTFPNNIQIVKKANGKLTIKFVYLMQKTILSNIHLTTYTTNSRQSDAAVNITSCKFICLLRNHYFFLFWNVELVFVHSTPRMVQKILPLHTYTLDTLDTFIVCFPLRFLQFKYDIGSQKTMKMYDAGHRWCNRSHKQHQIKRITQIPRRTRH